MKCVTISKPKLFLSTKQSPTLRSCGCVCVEANSITRPGNYKMNGYTTVA